MPDSIDSWRIKTIRTIFSIAGLGVGILLACAGYFHQMEGHKRVASWVKTPCRILKWQVEVRHTQYGDNLDRSILYEHQFGGTPRLGQNYDEATDWEVDLRDFEEEGAIARRGPAYCHVNPADPSRASFRGPRLWFPYSLIGGGLALASISFVFLVRTFFSVPKRRESDDEWTRRMGRRLLCLMGIGFVWAGINLARSPGLVDAVRGQVIRSRLIQVPARIEMSGVHDERGSGRQSHMTCHIAHIVYSYERDGRRWHSNRWYFDKVGLNGGAKDQARELSARYPQGMSLSVWIDPEQPWMATLDPALRWDMIWFAIPLGFMAGGAWLVWRTLTWR